MFILIPYKNDREINLFPAVTYALIAANICLYFVLLPINRATLAATMGFTPSHLSLLHIISSMFVHGDFWHLLWNMFFLWLFGPNVEDAVGHIEFSLLYLGSGIAAAILQVGIVHGFMQSAELIPVIGASGAISGILGVFAVRFLKTGIRVFYMYLLKYGTFTVPAMWGLGIWFMQQLIGGVIDISRQGSGGVAYWSHIGGMLFGMALAYGLSMSREGLHEHLISDVQKSSSDQAVDKLRKALDTDPNNAEICLELGRTYCNGDNQENAIRSFRQVVDLCLKEGDRCKATAAFAELRHHYPKAHLDARSEYQITRYLLEAKCYESALKMLDELSDAFPDTPEAELSLMMAGDLCINTLNDVKGAYAYYEAFCTRYPNSHLFVMVDRSRKDIQAGLKGKLE
ncbi:MAG: rhomboid family intramembrane serine protease [Armatimonadota bacterium]